ncbi:MAG TPA: hypothetical protein VFW71_01720 [Actinomycetota bacterium]|nr:hypothetical protein [Actinomycetota bacterium]
MKRHPFDLFSGFFGALFAVLGILLLSGPHGLQPGHLAVVGPAVVIAAGVALLASVVRGFRSRPGTPDAYAEEPADPLVEEVPPES